MLTQRPDETNFDYHRRLVYGKLVDRTLADVDYTELAPLLYGQAYNSDVCRRMLYGSCKTLQKIDEDNANKEKAAKHEADTDELDLRRVEFEKAKQRFYDQRAAFMKTVRERARQEELNEIIRSAISSSKLPTLPTSQADADTICGDTKSPDLLVSLNDIHFGANIDNHWCTYNSDICATMLYQYAERIASIAKTHGSRNCIVWANGDLISGNIHYQIAVSNNENVIEQVIGVSELIAGFLAILSTKFDTVKYASVAGNHSRIDVKDRALINERLDDLVGWYLKARLQNYTNVEVGYGDHIDATMYVIDVRGKTYVGVHGDYDTSPQHIQALQTMAGKPVYAVLMGHKHHCENGVVQGIRIIMAGSFMGMDDFCVQKRIYGRPEQMVCVCDESGVLCSYNVPLSK